MVEIQRLLDSSQTDAETVLVDDFSVKTERQNQCILFLKPETFHLASYQQRQDLLALVFEKLDAFGVSVDGCMMLSGTYMDRVGCMDRHYGYINTLSRNASHLVDGDDLDAVYSALGLGGARLRLLGGHEALEAFPHLTPDSLNGLWAAKASKRLRGGFYFQSYELQGQATILVNGFHPQQLHHFTGEGQRTAVFLVSSDTDWTTLRSEMIGDGFPEKAAVGSIRRTIFERRAAFGLSSVTIANNFVHLSAGPFEAMFEMHNFLSDLPGVELNLLEGRVARELTPSSVDTALSNPTSEFNGGTKDLFSATEEINTREAVVLFRDVFAPVSRGE